MKPEHIKKNSTPVAPWAKNERLKLPPSGGSPIKYFEQ